MVNSHRLILDCPEQCYYQENLASNFIYTHLYMFSIIPVIYFSQDTTIVKILVDLLGYFSNSLVLSHHLDCWF